MSSRGANHGRLPLETGALRVVWLLDDSFDALHGLLQSLNPGLLGSRLTTDQAVREIRLPFFQVIPKHQILAGPEIKDLEVSLRWRLPCQGSASVIDSPQSNM